MATIQVMKQDALVEAPGSPGIVRQLAFEGHDVRVIRSLVDPGSISGWHHHGDYDVYGYLVSGTLRFEYGPGGGEAIAVGPGEFFHVPAQMVHRDVNPSDTEGQDVVLFLRGSGAMVINVESPGAA